MCRKHVVRQSAGELLNFSWGRVTGSAVTEEHCVLKLLCSRMDGWTDGWSFSITVSLSDV